MLNLLKSLHSRGYVRKQFSWNHHYYYLTNEGIDYLRATLHLPADIVPNTLKKSARPANPRFGERLVLEGGHFSLTSKRTGGDREGRPEREERGERSGEYRRSRVAPGAGEDGKDKAAPGGDFKPRFVS